MTFVLISLITASFTPVITKKLTSPENSGNYELLCNGKVNYCAKYTSSCACEQCDAGYYLNTTCQACPVGHYCDGINMHVCENGTYASSTGQKTCIIQPAKSSNPNGCYKYSNSSAACDTCYPGYQKSSGDCSKCLGKNCTTFDTVDESGVDCKCSECDLGYDLGSEGECERNWCNPENGLVSVKVTIGAENRKLCITQYNIGDGPSGSGYTYADVVKLVSVYPVNGSSSLTHPLCWRGSTAALTCSGGENGNYSGCRRVLCDWSAAEKLCNNLKINGKSGFRLPTKLELKNLDVDKYSIGKGNMGLMLCDSSARFTSTRCPKALGCNATGATTCYPYEIWGDSPTVYGDLSGGRFQAVGSSSSVENLPMSVRCVKQLN